MSKYICVGTHVVDKKNDQRIGKVICVDRKAGVAIMQNGGGYWGERLKNLDVTSYKGVE